LFFDDRLVVQAPGQLAGTVCVYPPVGSEIFVSRISIDGEVDRDAVVGEPIGRNL